MFCLHAGKETRAFFRYLSVIFLLPNREGGLINFLPLKRGGLLEGGGLFEMGGLIEDLR